MRTAQDPELGEPGEVAELPGEQVDAGLRGARCQASSSRSIVRASVVARASRSASASAAPARRRASAAIVGAAPCHHRSMSAVIRMAVAARSGPRGRRPRSRCRGSHRLAGARRGQQRQLAHGGALAALPRAGRAGRHRRRRRRRRAIADLLIALHARRSAASIARWRERSRRRADRPRADRHGPLSRSRRRRGRTAFAGVCQPHRRAAGKRHSARLDAASRAKAVVIVQSAPALRAQRSCRRRRLRRRRPPARGEGPADAVSRGAPARRRPVVPTIVHVGAALDARLADEARATMAACPSYRWLGALSHAAARRTIARARALVH